MADLIGRKLCKALLWSICIIISYGCLGLLAHPQAAPLAFEVVSVKVNKPGQHRELSIQYLPGGRFSARALPIPLLILGRMTLRAYIPVKNFASLM